MASEIDKLKQVIADANDALFDQMSSLDVEHQITRHADTLPEAYRRLAEAAEKAFGLLQSELYRELDP